MRMAAACSPCFGWLCGDQARQTRRSRGREAGQEPPVGRRASLTAAAGDIAVFRAVQERVTTRYTGSSLDLSVLRLNYDPTRPVNKQYKTLQRIGAGAFGSVFKVKHATTGQIRAMKVLNKKAEVKEDIGFVITEIEAVVRLDHPNIAKFFHFFEDSASIYIISELCSEGDFSQIQRGKTSKDEVTLLFQDVFRGVAYCHDQGIAHRDLKFENCLLCQGQSRKVGKVIDFGLSAIKPESAEALYMNEALGTKYFVAPEVIEKKMYGVKCDIWSLGVMMYIVLAKEHPFAEDATRLPTKQLFRKILNEKLRLKPLDRAHVEPSAVQLLKALLNRSVPDRLSAPAALEQPWLQTAGGPVAAATEDEMLDRLVTFKDMSRFEKTVLMMVAHQTDLKLVEDLHAEFVKLDTHADGSLSLGELKAGLEKCGKPLKDSELSASFDSVDLNLNGKIDYSEWLSATINPSRLNMDAAMQELFQFFDHDNDGAVEYEELREVVGDSEARKVLDASDTSGDGVLDWDEFKVLMHEVANHRVQLEHEHAEARHRAQ